MGFRPDDNQVERHGRTHSMASSSNSSSGKSQGEIKSGRQHRGAGGTGLVVIGGVFVEMDDDFVFTMDTPVDRNYFLDRIIRGLLFAARVEKP